MTALEQMNARLEEINKNRDSELSSIKDRIAKYSKLFCEAVAKMLTTEGDPNKLEEYTAAKLQADEASNQMNSLKARYATVSKRNDIRVNADETRKLAKALRAEGIAENIRYAQKALELTQELFKISQKAVSADRERKSILTRWQHEADTTTDLSCVLNCTEACEYFIKRYSAANINSLWGDEDYDSESAELIRSIERLSHALKEDPFKSCSSDSIVARINAYVDEMTKKANMSSAEILAAAYPNYPKLYI